MDGIELNGNLSLSLSHMMMGLNTGYILNWWQERHAAVILRVSKTVSDFRYVLCPRRMRDEKFWRIYFILVDKHVRDAYTKAMAEEEARAARERAMEKEAEEAAAAAAVAAKAAKTEVELAEARVGGNATQTSSSSDDVKSAGGGTEGPNHATAPPGSVSDTTTADDAAAAAAEGTDASERMDEDDAANDEDLESYLLGVLKSTEGDDDDDDDDGDDDGDGMGGATGDDDDIDDDYDNLINEDFDALLHLKPLEDEATKTPTTSASE